VKKIYLVLLAVTILFAASVTILAHDFWLVPNKFRINPGDSLTISANTGMDFPNSLSAVSPDRIDKFILVGKSKKENITEFKVQETSLIAKYLFQKPGTFVFAAAVKPKEIKLTGKEFNEYLLADGLPHI